MQSLGAFSNAGLRHAGVGAELTVVKALCWVSSSQDHKGPMVQLGVVGIPVKTFRNAVLSREIAHCNLFL